MQWVFGAITSENPGHLPSGWTKLLLPSPSAVRPNDSAPKFQPQFSDQKSTRAQAARTGSRVPRLRRK
jgi:hypothetical protein